MFLHCWEYCYYSSSAWSFNFCPLLNSQSLSISWILFNRTSKKQRLLVLCFKGHTSSCSNESKGSCEDSTYFQAGGVCNWYELTSDIDYYPSYTYSVLSFLFIFNYFDFLGTNMQQNDFFLVIMIMLVNNLLHFFKNRI